jgi:hypothetical protein
LIDASEVALNQVIVGDNVLEFPVCFLPEVVNYFARLYAEPLEVCFEVALLLQCAFVDILGEGSNVTLWEKEQGAVPYSLEEG